MTTLQKWSPLLVVVAGCAHASPEKPPGYSLDAVDEPPRLLTCALPQGGNTSVFVVFNVDSLGAVQDAKVEQVARVNSAGKEPWAAKRALEVIHSCRFDPAKLNNTPVAVHDVRRVVFVAT